MSNIFQRGAASGFNAAVFNVHATNENTNMTMVVSDNPNQAFNNSSNVDLTLPTTGVPKGYVITIANLTGNSSGVIVKSSDGSAISIANGANQEGTIAQGHITLIANVAAPTTPAEWQVFVVEEEGQQTFTVTSSPGGSYSQTATFNFCRDMEQVTWSYFSPTASAGGANQSNLVAAASSIAARLAPADTQVIASWFQTAGSAQSGYIQFNSDGSLSATLPGSVFVNNCSLGIDGTSHNVAVYLTR